MQEISFSPFPEIITDNLILRRLSIEDENEIFILRSDPVVLKFLDRKQCESVEEARQFILKIIDGIGKNLSLYWAINKLGSYKLAGTICLWNFSAEKDKAEIGYELLPEYQGRGIIQEAINAVIAFGFNNLQLNTIEAYVHYLNEKSIKVLKRNSFILKEGFADSTEQKDMIVYELEKTVWEKALRL